MTLKPPTPQGISALLRKAGFDRASVDRFTLTAGFFVMTSRADPGGGVRVGYRAAHVGSQTAATRSDLLAKYTEAIKAAGWNVEAGEYELTVTAGKEG